MIAAIATAGLLAGATANAAAVSVSCPAVSGSVFRISTDPAATCLAVGAGQINGNGDAINQLGYITLDKSRDLISGALPQSLTITLGRFGRSGTFSINAPGYTDFVIALQLGAERDQRGWAAFALPSGVTSGSWTGGDWRRRTYVTLYGKLIDPVPLPASVWLFGSSLGLLGLVRRKQRTG